VTAGPAPLAFEGRSTAGSWLRALTRSRAGAFGCCAVRDAGTRHFALCS